MHNNGDVKMNEGNEIDEYNESVKNHNTTVDLENDLEIKESLFVQSAACLPIGCGFFMLLSGMGLYIAFVLWGISQLF